MVGASVVASRKRLTSRVGDRHRGIDANAADKHTNRHTNAAARLSSMPPRGFREK